VSFFFSFLFALHFLIYILRVPCTDPFRRLDKDTASAGGSHRRAAHPGRLPLPHADTSLWPGPRISFS
jgi:hypothetical protein